MSYITGLSPAINAAIAKKEQETKAAESQGQTSGGTTSTHSPAISGQSQSDNDSSSSQGGGHPYAGGGSVNVERIEREAAARVDTANQLAVSVNAMGTAGGYAGESSLDAAVAQLDEAIVQRDSASHPFVMEQYQAGVDRARENLQEVIRQQIDSTPGAVPHAGSVNRLDEKRAEGADIVDTYVDDPLLYREVQRATDIVLVDVEVDDSVALIESRSEPDAAYQQLITQFDDVSDEAQARLLQHESVDVVLDDVIDTATQPLHEVSTSIYPHLNNFDAVENVESLVVQAEHPELAAEVVARALPAFDQALIDNANKDYLSAPLIQHYSTVDKLGVIADSIVGAQQEDELTAGLASFAIKGARDPSLTNDSRFILPLVSEGRGITLALEMANQLDADPNVDAGLVVDKIVDDYRSYADGAVQQTLSDYAEHTAELNFLVSSFPAGLPPERLQAAIDDYLEGKDQDWHDQLNDYQQEIGNQGANLIYMQQRISGSPHLNESTEEKLEELAGSDDYQTAVRLGLQSNPDAFFGDNSHIDVDQAVSFFDGLDVFNSVGSLGREVSNAYVQNTLTKAIVNLESGDPKTYAEAIETLNDLKPTLYKTPGSTEAEIDGAIAAFEGLLNDLRDTQGLEADEIARAYTEAYEDFEKNLINTSVFAPDHPLGKSFRLFGVAAGIAAAGDSINTFADDPTKWNGFVAAVDGLTLVQDGGELLIDLGKLSDDSAFANRIALNNGLGKTLGAAGVLVSGVGVVNDIRDGNHATAAWGAVGAGGGALAVFGSTAWAGPVGIAIGLIAFGGAFLGAKVDASNKFTGEEAREFFKHAGLDDDAARALADRSGDGYSPIPILFQYAGAHGLSPTETVEWLNGLSKSELDWMRDRFHHTLDKIDGDLTKFEETSESDEAWLEAGWFTTPISVRTADQLLENRGIELP